MHSPRVKAGLHLPDQPVLLTDHVDQFELRLAPVHVLFLVLVIILQHIKGGIILLCFFHDRRKPGLLFIVRCLIVRNYNLIIDLFSGMSTPE